MKWDSARAKLKKQFREMNIVTCEMCGRSDALSFAHRLKRRYVTTDEELCTVALLCMDFMGRKGCHNKLEHGPKDVMFDTITKLIENRNEQIATA